MNPFVTHRSKVLGRHSTASWLRRAVLCMHSGLDHPLSLSHLGEIDDAHFNAFVEMLTHYRRHGETDLAFMTLAKDCLEMLEEERTAKEREERWTAWSNEAKGELRKLGLDHYLLDDRYGFFEGRFDAGDTPAAAALEAKKLPPLV